MQVSHAGAMHPVLRARLVLGDAQLASLIIPKQQALFWEFIAAVGPEYHVERKALWRSGRSIRPARAVREPSQPKGIGPPPHFPTQTNRS